MQSTVLLFDVDGTLTEPRQPITSSMQECLGEKRKSFELGIVSGSDLVKIKEQLGNNLFEEYDYIFAENGLVAFDHKKLMPSTSITEHLGQDVVQSFINYCLKYISNLNIPVKTNNFVELRQGLINVSPVGRDCSTEQRNNFEKYDKIHKVRETMIKDLQSHFNNLDLEYSIGGQISFDVFPKGWDKSYCLKYLNNKVIHFFGDKTEPGGNDYEIFHDGRVIGHAVNSFHDTIKILETIKP